MRLKIVRGALAAALFLPLAGCSDFIAPPESDPNAVPFANVDQLFVAHQANLFLWHGGTAARFNSIWMQQMGGVARQSSDHMLTCEPRTQWTDFTIRESACATISDSMAGGF